MIPLFLVLVAARLHIDVAIDVNAGLIHFEREIQRCCPDISCHVGTTMQQYQLLSREPARMCSERSTRFRPIWFLSGIAIHSSNETQPNARKSASDRLCARHACDPGHSNRGNVRPVQTRKTRCVPELDDRSPFGALVGMRRSAMVAAFWRIQIRCRVSAATLA